MRSHVGEEEEMMRIVRLRSHRRRRTVIIFFIFGQRRGLVRTACKPRGSVGAGDRACSFFGHLFFGVKNSLATMFYLNNNFSYHYQYIFSWVFIYDLTFVMRAKSLSCSRIRLFIDVHFFHGLFISPFLYIDYFFLMHVDRASSCGDTVAQQY